MEYNDIKKKLQILQTITPDASFAARTKEAVLAHVPRKRVIELVNTSWIRAGAFSFAGVAVAVLVGIIIFFAPARTPAVASLESIKLTEELNNLSINIQLKEISYRDTADHVIASAIDEIQNTEVKHLNPSIIKEEAPLPNITTKNTEIDTLLNTLTK